MTEFLIAAPILVAMMTAALYFRDLHLTKLRTMQQAREQAWSAAYGPSGCSLRDRVESSLPSGVSNALQNSGGIGDMFGQVLNSGNLFWAEREHAQASNGVQAPPMFGNGPTMNGHYYMYCNEPGYDQDAFPFGPVTIVRGIMQIYWQFTWL